MPPQLEERLQLRDDRFLDQRPDVSQNDSDALPRRDLEGLAKSYDACDCEIRVKLFARVAGEPQNFVAVFQRMVPGVLKIDLANDAGVHGCHISDSGDYWWKPVLVDVVEGVESLKPRPIPSVVRLHRLQEVEQAGWHFGRWADLFRDTALERTDARRDGELTDIGVARRVGPTDDDGEPVGEMVERLPHRVGNVSDGQSDGGIGWFVSESEANDLLSGLRIVLMGHGLRISHRPIPLKGLERVQMVLRPLNLVDVTRAQCRLQSMVEKKNQATQKTRPKKGEPAEIPVPKRGEVERDLLKIAKPDRAKD